MDASRHATMLRSKKEVDRRVRDLLNKTKTEEERKVRGYTIARLYFNIGEYTTAARYLAEFLMARPRAMDAHRLLGEVHEKLGNKEKAVLAYKTAYELGEGQKDLVLKICQLYTEVEADSSVLLYWADEGQRLYPHRESVVKLREALLSRNGTHSREELEKLYLEEIKASPTEVRLQTNLLQLYKSWGAEDSTKLAEAYSYGCQVEARKAFSDSLEWYKTLLDVMEAYRNTSTSTSEDEGTFYTNYLSALERIVYFTLASCTASALLSQYTLQDAATLLQKFDQSLKSHLHVVGAKSMFGQLMVGQLYLHMAIFLIHNAKEGLIQSTITSGALLLHACRFRPEKTKAWLTRERFWHKLACHRLSQAAHVLRHMATDRAGFLDKVKQQCSNKEAQLSIYQNVFGPSANTKKDSMSSFFMSNEEFVSAPLQYPDPDQLMEWDRVVAAMHCGSLGDLVWLCLQQVTGDITAPQPYYSFTLFYGLQLASSSPATSSPETLCHLDLLAFLAATVYCQRVAVKETHRPPPASLPTILNSSLCTQEQAEFWSAAYTLFTNRAHHCLSKLRMVVQRGLEVIRAHGNHGIDLPLMAHLAQCFTKWASVAETDGTSRSVEALRERAEHYWQRVLSLCDRLARNIMSVAPRNPLFVAPGMSLSEEERSKMEEEGKFFLALRLVQAGKQQDAIQALGELKSPEAAFQRAILYNEQAQAVVGEGGLEAASPEVRAQQASLLTQARDTLYLTLDRLRMPGVDRFHPLNTKLSQQLEDVERRLSLITAAAGQSMHHHLHHHNEEDTESDASHSPHDLTNGHDPTSTSPHLHQHQHYPSTPTSRLFAASSAVNSPQKASTSSPSSRVLRQEARPSPERLHAQVQALSEVQENTLRNMEEQNAALKAQNDALRNLCTSMADGFRENSNLYRSMLEQNRAISQDAYTSVVGEVRQVHAALKDTQTQLRTMAADLAELKSLRAAAVVTPAKLPEVAEVKASEEVPVDIPAAVVPPGLYGGYAGYYSQPSPLMPTPGLFGNPPFFPPSTVAEQTYIIASSVNQGSGGVISSMAQTTATPCSPASITVPSPAATSLPHSQATTGGWSITSTLANNSRSQSGDSPAPPHAFQITMPPASSTTLTPPPRSAMPVFPVGGFRSANTTTTTSPPKDAKVSPSKGSREFEEENECYVEDDHDPCPDYKPLVPLPEKVEVRTGEEDEQVLFEERAKLFRFVDKEWRERGTGVMKLLHNPGQSSARVLMRRDQTHKICANHLITSNIELQPMKANDRAWIWAAQDFADEELQMEKFCCRFKTVEVANSFREAFTKAKAIAKAKEESAGVEPKTEGAPTTPTVTSSIKSSTPIKHQTPPPTTTSSSSLAMLFKPPPGSWKCDTCLVMNKAEVNQCVACLSPIPNASTPAAAAAASAMSPLATFKFSPSLVPSEGEGTTTTPSSVNKFMGFPPTTTTTTTTPTLPQPNATVPSTSAAAAATPSGFGFKFGITTTTSNTSSPSVSAPPPPPASTTTTTSTTTSDPGKFSLSGFTFTTTPSISPEKKTEEPKEEKKKEFVFAGFSFGSGTTTTTTTTATLTTGFTFATPLDSSGVSFRGSIFGGKSPSSGMSFGSAAATTTTTTSGVPSIFTTKAFEPQSPSLGASRSPQKDDSDCVEEYEPQVDFQPVVPMPDLVEVKTGEEGEDVLFCERSKLYRYDKDIKEWKERGIGELKILRNTSSGKVRVLMRREQVLKVCANHFITPGIKITPMPSSDKAWMWAAQDFADEEVRKEQFAARFKTQELALAFKEAFVKAQLMQEPSSDQDTSKPSQATPAAAPTSTSTAAPSLASLFPKAAGSWECQACLVNNAATDTQCVSCSTPRQGQTKNTVKPEPKTAAAPATSSLAGMFQPAKGSWECDTCLIRNDAASQTCVACGSLPPGVADSSDQAIDLSKGQSPASSTALGPSTFKFGAESSKQTFTFGVPQSQQAVTAAPATQPAFTFGLKSPDQATDAAKPSATFSFGITTTNDNTTASTTQPTFSFGSTTPASKPFTFMWQPPASSGPSVSFAPTQPVAIPSSQHVGEEATTPTSTTPTKGGFVFGSPGKYEFSFAGVKAKSPRSRDISLCESEEGVVEEDEGDHLYFEPVVPLPDKVDVVTGEENEEVQYSHRAKLFRLVTGEWKERGIGDFKILKHRQNGKVRLLMRREQVHKLCLNHYLDKDLEVRRKDEKTFYWAALDHSEPQPKTETFALRFKTPEIAAEFLVALNEAKVKLGGTATELPKAESTTPAKTDTTTTTSTTSTSTSTPTKEIVAVVAQADSTTPASTTATSTATSMFFSGASKSLFGDVTTPTTPLFGSTPPAGSVNTTSSTFTITTSAPLFSTTTIKTPLFGNTTITTPNTTSTPHIFGGPPAFTVNVSSNFSLRGSLPLSMSTDSTTSRLSIFGSATTTSSIPRSSFSFGDKFSSEPDTTEEIQITYEKKATAEQIARARKLHLPDNFYLYEDAPPCPGCPGCEEGDKDAMVKITATTPLFGGVASIKTVQFGSTSTSTSTFGKLGTDSPSIFGSSNSTTAASTSPGLLDGLPNMLSSRDVFGSAAPTSGNVFGGTPATTGSVFGSAVAVAATTTTSIIFGGMAPTSSASIFSGATPASGSIFGGSPATSGSVFGGGTPTTTISFGAPTTTTTSGFFANFAASGATPTTGFLSGGAAAATKLFSTPTTTATTNPTTPGFFSASLASATAAAAAAATTTTASLFSTPPVGLLGSGGPFGSKGGGGGLLQTSQPSQSPSTGAAASPSLAGGASLFPSAKDNTALTFADLAQTSSSEGFGKKPLDPKVAAVWASQPVFGKSPKKGGGEEEDEGEDAHDPHFEPVVPLPDLVEVKTGEEDMEVVFCQRSKLYRYDGASKQWKERGVGDFKILYDPATCKYRLLQRREQVHKLCCNHYLTTQLILRPLQSSEIAWCWYATDFSDKPEGVNEQLALKFKTIELAKEFKAKFEECQEKLRANPPPPLPPADSSSTSTSATVVLPLTTTTKDEDEEEEDEEEEEVEEEEEEEDEDDTDDDEEDEDDEEDSSVMFSERCTLSRKDGNHWKLLDAGQLTMRYDDDVFGARITITSDCGETLAEHIVAIQTAMHKEGHSATWSVLNLKPEPQTHATFKATFFTQEATDTFAKAFLEAKEFAENSNLAEEPSFTFGDVLAKDLYYGRGTDED